MLATPELLHEAGQAARLAELLPRYQGAAPLYRATALAPDAGGLEQLRHFPLITKHDIRNDFPRNFLGADVDAETLAEEEMLELEHTSGTSEERTALLLPRGWWTEQERRALRLNPVAARVLEQNPAARRVTIASPVCSSDICYTSVPARDDRVVDNSLFLTLSRYPFLWSESDLARMAAEARDWEPQFLDLDPVYGVVFARYCERHGIRLPTVRFVLCSYEYLSVVHRQILERVFGVPVFDLYGSTETGHLLMEQPDGLMRPTLDTAFLEVIETDAAGVGQLVVTTFTNDLMPLVRYRIGDLVQRLELPYCTRYVLHGRALDAFRTRAGRLTTRQVDQCFAGLAGFAHYQLLQRPKDDWLLRFVPDAQPPSARALETAHRRLSQLLNPSGSLALEPSDLLMPESSGKFRLGYPLAS
jgi:phenylacetate-coenzyme A ligase PaaK-like adenylate-forming protein